MKKEILYASTNIYKHKQIKWFLDYCKENNKNLPIELVVEKELPEVEEDRYSFIENALLKAREISKHTQKPCIADDSGIMVDSLDGKPGVFSKRFSAMENKPHVKNIDLLLQYLKNVENRKAMMVCAIAYVRDSKDALPIIQVTKLEGSITESIQGDSNFGYENIFFVPEIKATLGQKPLQKIYHIHHRIACLQKMFEALS